MSTKETINQEKQNLNVIYKGTKVNKEVWVVLQ